MVASLGDFFVNIKTNVADNNVKKYTQSLTGVGKTALKVGGILTTAFVGAGYGFSRLLNGVVMETAELGRLSEDLGVSPQFLENFTRSFEAVGATAGDAIGTIRTLKTEVEAFRLGRGDFETFGILGINPQQLTEDTTQSLDTIRNRFKDLSKSQQLYFVNQIGLSEKSLRVLRLTDKEYENLTKSSNQSPLVSNSQIQNAERYARNIRRLSQSFTSFKRALVSTATPAFTTFTNNLTKLFQNPAFQQDVGQIFDNLFSKTLPAIIKGAPIFIEQIKNITSAINDLATGVGKISDNRFIKILSALGKVGGAVMYDAPVWLGQQVADLIDNQIEAANAPRGVLPINPITGAISSQVGQMTDKQLRNSGLGGSLENRRMLANGAVMNNNNSITINVAKSNASPEDIAKVIGEYLDRRESMQSENFKGGNIQ
jgi:hypothetical protein